MAAAKKKVVEKNPMVATPIDRESLELATKPVPSDTKYRCDFKSYEEYNKYKGKKG